MALASKGSSFSLGQRLWSTLSAWTIRNAGYQKLGRSFGVGLEENAHTKHFEFL